MKNYFKKRSPPIYYYTEILCRNVFIILLLLYHVYTVMLILNQGFWVYIAFKNLKICALKYKKEISTF